MTNPFKKVAFALFLRGALFSLLGLISIIAVIPALMNIEMTINVARGVIGLFLLGLGIRDIIAALQRFTPLRVDRLEVADIGHLYRRSKNDLGLPVELMNADANPNEQDPKRAGKAREEWISRVYPRFAFLPQPYKTVFRAALVALGLGITSLFGMLFLRIVLARGAEEINLSALLDWYQWMSILIGYGFWFSISRYGFRNAFRYEKTFHPFRVTGLFVVLLIAAALASIAIATTESMIPVPPSLGFLTPLMWVGSLVTIVACVAFVYLRSQRAPEHYGVHRAEEFFTVSMHPTDIINSVKSYVGRMGGGSFTTLGDWKPTFEERSAVSAGEFHADLHAESVIQLNETGGQTSEAGIGTILAYIGIGLSAVAGFFLWSTGDGAFSDGPTIANSLRLPIALLIFGALFYRLGSIAIAEMQWTSIATYTHMDGTFQTQGGMALMQSGDQSVKGSVLTSATVQPKAAYITSIGYLDPGRAKNELIRIIDRVEPAEPVATEMLEFIRNQAANMMSAGAPVAPPMASQIEHTDPPPIEPANDTEASQK